MYIQMHKPTQNCSQLLKNLSWSPSEKVKMCTGYIVNGFGFTQEIEVGREKLIMMRYRGYDLFVLAHQAEQLSFLPYLSSKRQRTNWVRWLEDGRERIQSPPHNRIHCLLNRWIHRLPHNKIIRLRCSRIPLHRHRYQPHRHRYWPVPKLPVHLPHQPHRHRLYPPLRAATYISAILRSSLPTLTTVEKMRIGPEFIHDQDETRMEGEGRRLDERFSCDALETLLPTRPFHYLGSDCCCCIVFYCCSRSECCVPSCGKIDAEGDKELFFGCQVTLLAT
ncbi:hypothetical protein M9H77_30405 [Catharanthus roseus]|uniref:Uncharacterized protein n=1 Tax=Catharanthus roseus TaxID=4058 RepID=A0ACB9ZX52_CATRO|nr:hypothetical protein M9H77_30405 [Catharanthus roseus]